jgi:hypothetical protein
MMSFDVQTKRRQYVHSLHEKRQRQFRRDIRHIGHRERNAILSVRKVQVLLQTCCPRIADVRSTMSGGQLRCCRTK